MDLIIIIIIIIIIITLTVSSVGNRFGFLWVANSPVSNQKLPLNTNIDATFIQGYSRRQVKYSEIQANKCLKFEYT